MAKPISLEIRHLLADAVFERGFSRSAVAALFKVPVASAVRLCKRREDCGTVEPGRWAETEEAGSKGGIAGRFAVGS